MPTAAKKKSRRYDPLYEGDVPALLHQLREALSKELGVPVGKADAIRIALRESLIKRGVAWPPA